MLFILLGVFGILCLLLSLFLTLRRQKRRLSRSINRLPVRGDTFVFRCNVCGIRFDAYCRRPDTVRECPQCGAAKDHLDLIGSS
ncbi:MAG: zinc ribbon domain-containing protein [Candidatus Latescibacteria bacterium]|nr:zinc ribbon domain-containing protein [Candidatus Latescibacterota bacterium]